MKSAHVALLFAVLSSFGCSEFMPRSEAAGLRIARHDDRFDKLHQEADGLLNAAAHARALLYEALLNRPQDRDGIEGEPRRVCAVTDSSEMPS